MAPRHLTVRADGTYARVAQANATLGAITCPPGSMPNSEGTACLGLSQILCAEGYVPKSNEKTGEWEWVDALADEKVVRTVHGIFKDCTTELPLKEVSVTLQGLKSEDKTTLTTTTHREGYFKATGSVVGGQLVWAATKEGY
ncbi:hypothetical protein ACFL5O_10400 [Myxococcota bacterium]